ncbi:MAG TPA: TetR family transcriptional regulator C-terminal domain-containing protein [Roseiarcus sp.]|jgi:AcrR family transcriptional regulator
MRWQKKARSKEPRKATARGAATRARIIAAAADLVCRRGARATSLDDIMAASATSKSQLYHYFADKDALMRAVIELQTRRVTGGQATLLEAVDTLDRLRGWRDEVVAMNKAAHSVGGCPLGSLASELADQSESARAMLADGFGLWRSHLARALRAMRDRGELKEDAKPEDLATAVIAALEGGLLLAQTARTTRPLELALDMAIDHVARASQCGAAA